MLRLTYDPRVDAADIYLRQDQASVETQEIAPGVLIDFADDGRPIGIEILHASEVFGGPPSGVEFALLTHTAPAEPADRPAGR